MQYTWYWKEINVRHYYYYWARIGNIWWGHTITNYGQIGCILRGANLILEIEHWKQPWGLLKLLTVDNLSTGEFWMSRDQKYTALVGGNITSIADVGNAAENINLHNLTPSFRSRCLIRAFWLKSSFQTPAQILLVFFTVVPKMGMF